MKNYDEEIVERENLSSGIGEKEQSFNELIQNEYKEEFQKKFDREFSKRFRKMKETEEELSDLKEKIKPLLDYFGAEDLNALTEKLESDKKAKVDEVEKEDKADIYEKWVEEEAKTKEVYPEFNLSDEIENPAFLNGLYLGIPMTSLYGAMHFDEISEKIKAKAKKDTLENIRARSGRIGELGMEKATPVRAKKDVNALSGEEIEEILKKVKRGEKISFDK